jgi:BASS family bile acid:Na+ symporter
VSTLLAPVLAPLLVLWLAGEYPPVDVGGLFTSIVQIVLVPVVLGPVLRLVVPRLVERVPPVLPLVPVGGITAVVSARRAISIEVGMQDSGPATVHVSPAAALPAAVSSAWHTVSGSLLAGWWARRDLAARPDRDEAPAPGR